MSSPLEARIRTLAKEEAASLFAGFSGTDPGTLAEEANVHPTAELEKEVAVLRKTVEDLTTRLDALEKAPRRAATARKGTSE